MNKNKKKIKIFQILLMVQYYTFVVYVQMLHISDRRILFFRICTYMFIYRFVHKLREEILTKEFDKCFFLVPYVPHSDTISKHESNYSKLNEQNYSKKKLWRYVVHGLSR